jgi:beta-glucanase (GH16 family)
MIFNKILIALMVLTLWSCNSQENKNWDLVWSDEFDYAGLPDSTKWSYDTVGNKWGWGNNELQYYTSAQQKNATVSDGTLKIVALKDSVSNEIGKFGYTSARLITKYKGDWLYGRFEIKAKLPDGLGMWPAIWMLPSDWEYGGWPKSGEIDIMENVGYDPDNIVISVHTENYNHSIGTQRNFTTPVPDNSKAFHVYALEWDETTVKGFVDEQCFFTFNKESNDPKVWPFDKRFHLLLNVAVGGNWGGKKGVDSLAFPATMEVDYVRVFQKKN